MSETPLAEAYEKLKELRRRGGSESEMQSSVGHDFRAHVDLIMKMYPATTAYAEFKESTNLVRVLDIRTLADRVFGDEKKAEAWLVRPSAALSGQKPIDLLKDELGAAVVRETLEQIDSGIFA